MTAPGDIVLGATRLATVRTFKPRRRSLGANRQARFDELAQRWLIPPGDRQLDLPATFGRRSPVILEIGIGGGESCVAMAAAAPEHDLIGVDVHTPGIAAAMFAADADGLGNLRLFHGDVFDLVPRLTDGSLGGIRIYFPDPWPKVRHRARRLVSAERMAALVPKVAPGGTVHLATDVDDYADQMLQVCDRLAPLSGGVVDRPDWRPITRFEQRGVDAGRSIVDLLYTVGD